ncbi:DUF2927 domain-containing protein [Actinoplanes solisilvae]|uniref:DUF2927 domain-containing protein n=1 Tax=Actinoplanes solisilvae TaxID=2486853 RepID=UPI0013E3A861|nr:DUF2927 domain-containing protein [Actinoplanes solisilvae]
MRSTAGRNLLPVLLLACTALVACRSPTAGNAAPVTSATPSAPAPATTTTPEPAPATSKARPKPTISKAGLNYFFDIALGSEYGKKRTVVAMWNWKTVSIRVHGGSAKSRSCLNKVIADFNALTATTDLRLTTSAADIELHFTPVSKMRSLNSRYAKGNDGFFSAQWNDYAINRGTVLIRTTGISEGIRCHLIREELTQVMGLMRDSAKYRDSVFYSRYTPAPTRYSALDKEVIRLLYSGAVEPGDSRKTVTAKVTVKK